MYNEIIQQGLEHLPGAKLIRTEVFINEQHFDENNEFDDLDSISYHVLISDGESPMATGRLYKTPNKDHTYTIGRIAVLKKYRKKKLGTLVMAALERHGIKIGATTFELSAQVRAVNFYNSLGYTATGETYLDEHEPHIKMYKNI